MGALFAYLSHSIFKVFWNRELKRAFT
jgi:hypothetical protein